MKTTNTIILAAILIVGSGIISSCKKETTEPAAPVEVAPTPTLTPTPTPAPATKTELLTAKKWKITAYTVSPAIDLNGNGTMVSNIYAQMPACEKDDLYIFNVNSSVTADEGGSKCDPNNPQSKLDGTWTFNSTETIITWDEDYNIETLNSTTLKVNNVEARNGINYTFTQTLTKQ